MFRHIVLLRWVEEATEDQRAAVVAGLETLPGAIPEIKKYVIGTDAKVNEGNFDLGVVADFESVDDYLVYRDHPVHLKVVADFIKPIAAGRAAVQFPLG
ncbi:Dabb family protein [Herbidospora galbida]|uniref:Dabb family protein n=1 Tax=Herbidospora galbida TaxID=2575442 RepID=A0A4V6XBG5_9ACTN|nr:Dabb family protein [Herbidospora galbida]TKK89453.1 Dabb family protein [Herbidospora galbida]